MSYATGEPQKVQSNVISTLDYLEQKAHLFVSMAAVVVAAVNTHALPPKDAAAVVLISNFLSVINKAVSK